MKRNICGHLATAEHGGQKNCNGKMIAVLFSQSFLLMYSLSNAHVYLVSDLNSGPTHTPLKYRFLLVLSD